MVTLDVETNKCFIYRTLYPKGFMYLVAIIDWHSRLIVGWALSNTMQSDFVLGAIKEAIQAHGTPEIMNSDQGSQFTSKAFINFLKGKEAIRISMNGKGQCRDNARIERFFRNYKWERLCKACTRGFAKKKVKAV